MTMTSTSGPLAAPESGAHRVHPFLWSVRRELWENRAIYMAPLIAAGVVLFGFILSLGHPEPHVTIQGVQRTLPPELRYQIGEAVVLVTAGVVAVFYCLGALYNERRDRSILFWKSLPVSNLTTVLSKLATAGAVLPLFAFVVVVALHVIMLLIASAYMLVNGLVAAELWTELPLVRLWGLVLYSLIAGTLWWAPVWGWFLLVSAWAKRTPFLWAVGAPIAVCVVEKIAFSTNYAGDLLSYRLGGSLHESLDINRIGNRPIGLPDIDPGKFVSTPGLWAGLAVAVLFIAAAVWLRRRREPI